LNAVGVDVGGTKIAAGVITPDGRALSKVRYPTSSSPKLLLATIARAINEAREGFEVGGVCLSVPGFVSERENRVIYSPNLRAVEGLPLKEELEPRVGLPVTVENDANAAAWGELRFGLEGRVSHLVMVTLGTGIGGGVVTHGLLMSGAQGAAGELGHVTVLPDGPRCAWDRRSRSSPCVARSWART
jgi:glucokinase